MTRKFVAATAAAVAALSQIPLSIEPVWSEPWSVIQPVREAPSTNWKAELSKANMTKAADGSEEFAAPYYAPIAIGNEGSRTFKPVFSTTNSIKNKKVTVTYRFFGADGSPLAVPFRNQRGGLDGYHAMAQGTIEPGGEAGPMLFATTEPVKRGWVLITSDVPGALRTSAFTAVSDPARTGVMVHEAVKPTMAEAELGIENTPSPKQTVLSILNPGEDEVEVVLTPRALTGSPFNCKPVFVTLGAGASLHRSAQSLMSACVRAGAPNYTLNIAPLDGEIVTQAYYDYGSQVVSRAPVHVLDDEDLSSLVPEKNTGAKAAICRPTFDPMRPALTADEQDIEVEIDWDGCNPGQRWLLRANSTWYKLIDSKGRVVSSLAGTGSGTFTFRVMKAEPRKYSGRRTGNITMSDFTTGRPTKTLAGYSFTQPIPKL